MPVSQKILEEIMQGKEEAHQKTRDVQEAAEQRAKEIQQAMISTGLTLMGGPITMLSKATNLAKVPKLAKMFSVISKVTGTKEGLALSKLVNKISSRAIGDLFIKDVKFSNEESAIQARKDKAKGYQNDVMDSLLFYAQLQTKELEGVSGLGSQTPEVEGPPPPPKAKNITNVAAGKKSGVNIQNILGQNVSTTPTQQKNILGNLLTQKPSVYKGGVPYYPVSGEPASDEETNLLIQSILNQ
jgi:hypothetical protein